MSNIRLMVTRGDAEKDKELREYETPFKEGMSLLDALLWIREKEDPSLGVRYSCRSANACKECMALVNGKPGYLCSIRATEGSTTTIEPLPKRPWVKDIVTIID
ncbi:succinate dehydrogenase/fumarate reductase-like Fe-S protein [Pullulanibacillus pueri]|uniref:Succinate dehydogenase/fumarate reductase N-terminal domain-containing protein n=1 Tax=Pullulanibacillus pueri TaxID=1437324 RepID=A0A8J3ES98_9BACL|nr:2Fe-2S iron-sulfur cluster-binding protein [Pullulanibacillus pueri]MBM7684097.1 succinate dehydrogenase/fumarate reductase-like Fe-S protein [Pullulanibacillus pueri]GGH88645.1 hypothetical protein GCM10007096_41450 [Pullulanibacillus pueri]